jgi:carboxymethylenebutenolidase
MAWIELTAADGHRLAAWRAEPAGTPRGGVVVVQEIFGVNSHIRNVTDRFAREGYLSIAPALFDRVERGVELGYDEQGIAAGRTLAAKLDYTFVMRDVAAARDSVASSGKVAAVGFCYGGAVVWLAAARLEGFSCVISYYGSRIVHLIEERPKIPTLMHVGRYDASFPMEKVREIGRRYPDVTIEEHDAGHGFHCDERKDYHPESAARAFARTLSFLREHVG